MIQNIVIEVADGSAWGSRNGREVLRPFSPNGYRKPSSLLLGKSFSKINESIPYVNRTPSKVFIEKLEELMKMGPRRLRYLRSSYECDTH